VDRGAPKRVAKRGLFSFAGGGVFYQTEGGKEKKKERGNLSSPTPSWKKSKGDSNRKGEAAFLLTRVRGEGGRVLEFYRYDLEGSLASA